MAAFVNQYAQRAVDDLITLLGEIEIMPRADMPTDPAAWSDWVLCVEQVKNCCER